MQKFLFKVVFCKMGHILDSFLTFCLNKIKPFPNPWFTFLLFFSPFSLTHGRPRTPPPPGRLPFSLYRDQPPQQGSPSFSPPKISLPSPLSFPKMARNKVKPTHHYLDLILSIYLCCTTPIHHYKFIFIALIILFIFFG